MYTDLFNYRSQKVERDVGACNIRHENGQTTVTCPSVSLMVDAATATMKVHDRSKLRRLPLDTTTSTIEEVDGTMITIDRNYGGDIAVVSISSADHRHGYSVDVLPNPSTWLPWSKPTFTKELLRDGYGESNSLKGLVFDMAAGETIAPKSETH